MDENTSGLRLKLHPLPASFFGHDSLTLQISSVTVGFKAREPFEPVVRVPKNIFLKRVIFVTTSIQTRTPVSQSLNLPIALPLQAFRSVPDWATLVLAVYLSLAPLWTTGEATTWFASLGILLGISSLGALATASSQTFEWLSILVGVAIFISPWIGGFSMITGAAWTAWLVGILSIALAYVAMTLRPGLIDN